MDSLLPLLPYTYKRLPQNPPPTWGPLCSICCQAHSNVALLPKGAEASSGAKSPPPRFPGVPNSVLSYLPFLFLLYSAVLSLFRSLFIFWQLRFSLLLLLFRCLYVL